MSGKISCCPCAVGRFSLSRVLIHPSHICHMRSKANGLLSLKRVSYQKKKNLPIHQDWAPVKPSGSAKLASSAQCQSCDYCKKHKGWRWLPTWQDQSSTVRSNSFETEGMGGSSNDATGVFHRSEHLFEAEGIGGGSNEATTVSQVSQQVKFRTAEH